MKEISSRENPLYKELKSIATSSQARRKTGRTVLDGVHLCESYLEHVGHPRCCVVHEGSVGHPEVAAIMERCEAARAQCIVLPDALYQGVSQVEHGVGLLFLVDTPRQPAPELLADSAVLLDGLQDPGNLGSILRSAAAAGIESIFCSKNTAHAWSPKVLRAGMGAHFVLKICEGADLAALLASTTLPILATSSHAERTIYQVDLSRPVVWLFGHEGQGISAELLAAATHRVAIPHRGKIESLNVAASAAVCLFEQLRQQSQPSA